MRASRAGASCAVELVLSLACFTASVAPARADEPCHPHEDRTTGGGWLQPANGERTFGFVGHLDEATDGSGRLEFADHFADEVLRAEVTIYLIGPGRERTMHGHGRVDGEPADFRLRVSDGGGSAGQDVFDLTYDCVSGTRNHSGVVAEGEVRVHPRCG